MDKNELLKDYDSYEGMGLVMYIFLGMTVFILGLGGVLIYAVVK